MADRQFDPITGKPSRGEFNRRPLLIDIDTLNPEDGPALRLSQIVGDLSLWHLCGHPTFKATVLPNAAMAKAGGNRASFCHDFFYLRKTGQREKAIAHV
jgi:hypothetical protein